MLITLFVFCFKRTSLATEHSSIHSPSSSPPRGSLPSVGLASVTFRAPASAGAEGVGRQSGQSRVMQPSTNTTCYWPGQVWENYGRGRKGERKCWKQSLALDSRRQADAALAAARDGGGGGGGAVRALAALPIRTSHSRDAGAS